MASLFTFSNLCVSLEQHSAAIARILFCHKNVSRVCEIIFTLLSSRSGMFCERGSIFSCKYWLFLSFWTAALLWHRCERPNPHKIGLSVARHTWLTLTDTLSVHSVTVALYGLCLCARGPCRRDLRGFLRSVSCSARRKGEGRSSAWGSRWV